MMMYPSFVYALLSRAAKAYNTIAYAFLALCSSPILTRLFSLGQIPRCSVTQRLLDQSVNPVVSGTDRLAARSDGDLPELKPVRWD